MCVYIHVHMLYIYIHIINTCTIRCVFAYMMHMRRVDEFGSSQRPRHDRFRSNSCTEDTRVHNKTGVCKKTFLRRRRQVGKSAFKRSNQGLDCSFCCWTAWQRLHKRSVFSQTPVCVVERSLGCKGPRKASARGLGATGARASLRRHTQPASVPHALSSLSLSLPLSPSPSIQT